MVDRNLRKGTLKPAQVEAHLAALPDVESDAVPIGVPSPSLGRNE